MSVTICYEGDCVEIENAEELNAALEVTPPEADIELLNQIGEKITDLVKTDEEFLLILGMAIDARGASKKPYLQGFSSQLTQVVTKGQTIRDALALLANESDQEYFLNTLGTEGLRKCMTNAMDIAECLEWLYGKMDTLFLELLGWDFVIRFINSGENLSFLVKAMSNAEEKELLEKMGWEKVMACIQSPNDLMYTFIGLDSQNDRALIEKLAEYNKLEHVIPSPQELDRICQRGLTKAEADYLREKYEMAVKA